MKRQDNKKFIVEFAGCTVEIETYTAGAYPLYLAKFKNDEPLFLTESVGSDGHAFWTSIPEGRLKLAGEIGRLIEKRQEQIQPEQKELF